MLYPLLFATLAAIGNSMFVYGQRGAAASDNPFLFTCCVVLTCFLLLSTAGLIMKTPNDAAYVAAN